jgi:hypothetical protein
MGPEEFSLFLGFSYRTYRAAMIRRYVTYRILEKISQKCHVKIADLVDGRK